MVDSSAWALAFKSAIENEEERLKFLTAFDGEEGLKQVVVHRQRLLGIFLTPQALREGLRKELQYCRLGIRSTSP